MMIMMNNLQSKSGRHVGYGSTLKTLRPRITPGSTGLGPRGDVLAVCSVRLCDWRNKRAL